MVTKEEKLDLLKGLVDVIVESVNETKEGVPAMNLDQFNTIVDTLVTTGKIKKQGNLLLPGVN